MPNDRQHKLFVTTANASQKERRSRVLIRFDEEQRASTVGLVDRQRQAARARP